MSFFGKKSASPLRRRAENLLLSAEKVRRYRGDLFDDATRERFDADVAAAKAALAAGTPDNAMKKAAGTPDDELKNAADALEAALRETGGTIFPQKKIPEWVELIVVAAILAGGIRAFFVQPFKIPTNSMFPTYNGMTAELCTGTENFAEKWFERIFRSASFYEIKSPASGEVLIPLRGDATARAYFPAPPEKSGESASIVNPGKDVYRLFVGGNAVPVAVPRDFSLHPVLLKAFFPETEKSGVPENFRWREVLKSPSLATLPDGTPALRTGKFVRAGDTLLDFKIFGGDMVLVDRVSFHFREPRRGDPFVFRTRNIAGLNNIELYYIKRLAGLPGDTLRVASPKLLVNGVPADFAEAMTLNNAPTPEKQYYGYLPTSGAPSIHSWPLNGDFRVPDGFFYALGDNSANSYDSRGWGGVPEDEVVGSALFILYPFSRRWGPAK